jgi:phosphoribosylformylglycinamidine synthase
VGLLKDSSKRVDLALKAAGEALIVIGKTAGCLGASIYLREIEGIEDGAPPQVDLKAEKRNGDFVRRLIGKGLVSACHDASDGGLLCAVAEMALAGRKGAALTPSRADNAYLFGEDQARYVVATSKPGKLLALAKKARVPAEILGTVTDDASLTLSGRVLISVEALRAVHENWLPAYMSRNN